jgi:flagellar biosynthetic protein FliP
MIDRCATLCGGRSRPIRALPWVAAMLVLLAASTSRAEDEPRPRAGNATAPQAVARTGSETARPTGPQPTAEVPILGRLGVPRSLQTIVLLGLLSLAPVALLMVTAFVRINIVLTLLRQALGSPQVPGNQVLTALALMLTALVMWPMGETVYRRAIQPYQAKQMNEVAAWTAGSGVVKGFMVDQIVNYRHEDYLATLYEYATPPSPGQAPAAPSRPEDFPFRVVMPAYLLGELTTALMMGFYIYLPFLVIDLVVSSVLAATGLFMLPPALVATPVKLILFVLADGWLLVADMLLSSFAARGGGP